MKHLKRIGIVMHLSKNSGNLILNLVGDVKINDSVHDGKGMKIGTVTDVFGPVSNPLIAVKPKISDPTTLFGKPVYFEKRQ